MPKRIQLINPGNGLNINNAAVRHVKNYLLSHLNDVEESSEKYNELVRPFTKTIRELIHNVSQHGGLEEAQGSGLVIYTPPPKRYPWFRFCCSDIGEGFLGTIRDRRGIPCTTDREAVIEALLLRFFRKEEGVAGLYNAMRFIRERTGRIGIRTGGTYTLLDLSRPKLQHIFDEGYSTPSRDWLLDLTSSWNMPHIPGSHIFVDLRMPQED